MISVCFCPNARIVAQQTPSELPQGKLDTAMIRDLLHAAKAQRSVNPDSALILYQRVLHLSFQLGFERGLAASFPYIAEHLDKKGRYDEVKTMLDGIKDYCRKKGYIKTLPALYNSLAVSFQKHGNNDSASRYFNDAISIARKTGDSLIMDRLFINYGGMLLSMKQYSKAIEYLDQAEKYANTNKNYFNLTQVYLNKGNAYSNLQNWSKSGHHLRLSLEMARKNEYRQLEFIALTALGYDYLHQLQFKESIHYLKQAIDLSKREEIDPFYQNAAYRTLGSAYLEMGHLEQALAYFELAAQHGVDHGIGIGIMDSYRQMALVYSKLGDHKKAYAKQQDYIVLKDSFDNVATKELVNELELKYKTAEKDRTLTQSRLIISERDLSIKKRNYWILGMSLGLLLMAGIGLFAFALYRINAAKRKLQEQKYQAMVQQLEIDQLKATIQGEEKERNRIANELHDGIGGMLSSLRMNFGVLKDENPKIALSDTMQRISDQITATANEVRQTAHNLTPIILLRNSLEEALLHYCEVIGQGKLRVNVQCYLPVVIKKEVEVFIYRMIQELLQNVIKHANASLVVVQVMHYKEELNITVEDDGIGFDVSARNTSGAGLSNIAERTENIGGKIHINSTRGRGTTIQLTFDYSQLQKL